jgi:membrane protease YdiL (CAAX protease family)
MPHAPASAADATLGNEVHARPWKFWGTIIWGVAINATFIIVSALWLFVLVTWIYPNPGSSADPFAAILQSHQGPALGGFAISAACTYGVLALAIRRTGMAIGEYLGLIPPRARDLGLGFAGIVVIYLAFWGVFSLTNEPPSRYADDLYRDARAGGVMVLLLFIIVVAAPFAEELLFRGFLYRGFAASRLGPLGAVVLTSTGWALAHPQYDWPIFTEVFCFGLLYGWIRQRGGSTTATIILHGIQNAWSIAYLAIIEMLGTVPAP